MNGVKRETYNIGGMSCASCAARVEKALRDCNGVVRADVNFANTTAKVEFDSDRITPEDLRRTVSAAGYQLLIEEETDAIEQIKKDEYRSLRRRTVWAILLSLPVVIYGMFFMHAPEANLIMFLFSTPVVFLLGRHFFINATKQLRHGAATMDTLVALSTGIAWLFSVANMLWPEWWMAHGIHPHVYFEASAVIIAFILLGRTMESRARNNTSSAIRKLMGLQPKRVLIVDTQGKTMEVEISTLRGGEIIVARPGERIAADGEVTQGESYVDESMLSGEPIPVEKRAEAKVYAGTINCNGTFRYSALKIGEDTLLSKIIAMVQDARGSKPPVQKLVDRIAGVFVPVIIGISVLTFIIWMLCEGTEGFPHALLAAVTVLVIACPCALGLATPTAIMVGVGVGAENGILIKDAEALEKARKIDAVVLDKTGTLTEGRPSVRRIVEFVDSPRLDILYALEESSQHPLAQAITDYTDSVQCTVEGFENITGRGVKGCVDGREYLAGNRRMVEEAGIPISPEAERISADMAADANSIVWWCDSREVLALIGIADSIRSTSAGAVSDMKNMGIEVYMLTGDNMPTAEAVARRAGIDHVRAEVLPQDKSEFVKELQAEGKCVAMVGDGINDSAALAVADLSIAMGTGSDIAIDVAKMTIIKANLMKIPQAVRLSRATVRTIRQNLFWAFIYNIIGVPIAAGVLYPVWGFLLNPMIAGAAMAFSSVSVVTNSLLLKRTKLTPQSPATAPCTEEKPIPKTLIHVKGMMCEHCSKTVSNALFALQGAKEVTVNLAEGTVTIAGDIDLNEAQAAIISAGYEVIGS